MIRSIRVLAVCAFAALLSQAAPLEAQDLLPDGGARRSIPAARLQDGERIVLDGNLDEAVWRRAEPANDFIQVDPANGRPATEPTEVRVVFGANALYMGVTCFDSEPDKWLGYQRRRDEFLSSDDRFMWTIDTFLDARSGYFFEMNPSGLMADSLFGVNGDNRAWDGIWNARVRHTDFGWTIEIEIPFRTLNFNPDNDTWGMNFQRTVRRKNEDSLWMGWARNQGLRRMANAGHVTGIRNVTQGHGLDIKPYGLVTAESSPGRGATNNLTKGNGGVDLFYNPTPLMRATFTVNTDFAQTEVDQRQVNLTRYSLFFPERRDFFLDGATFFDFGSPAGDLIVNPFFSRRIGLSAASTPQKIDFGTKITGQMGGQDVGILHVRTGEDDDDDLIGEDFTVARVKRRMLRQSYVGALYTRRDARGDTFGASHTMGVDMRLATNSFLGNQNLEGTAWLLHASGPELSGRTSAYGGTIAYPNDRWDIRLDMREVQDGFDPALGFVTRRGYRRYLPSLAFQPRPRNSRIVRRYIMGPQLDLQTTVDNTLISRIVQFTVIEPQFQSQDSFGVDVVHFREQLDTPFAITSGITLPLGARYDFLRYRVRGQSANRRVLALNGRVEVGDFYSGTRTQSVAGLTIRARPGYIFSLNGEWNSVRLAEGAFNARVYRIVSDTQFSPFVAVVNNIQYDSVSRVLGWQARFRWILKPGNDLYVVYTHNWLDDLNLNRMSTLDRRFASKLLYTHRF